MQSTSGYGPEPIEKLEMDIENAIRRVRQLRVDLPRRGIKGLLHKNALTKASRELNSLEKEIEKVSNKLSKGNLEDISSIPDTMKSISERINKFSTKRTKSLKKPEPISSKLFFTKLGRAKAAALKEKETLKTYLSTYKELYRDALLPETSIFYFEPQFKAAFNNPAFTEFARELAEIIQFFPHRLSKPFDEDEKNLWQKFDSIVKEMNLPGDAGQLIVPFIRLLILKMDNPSLLSNDTINKLEALMEKWNTKSLELLPNQENADQVKRLDESRAACMYLSQGLEDVKENLKQYLSNEEPRA